LFVANLFFQAQTGGYWDAAAEQMPLLHVWSLAVEEQFYLVWPALLMLVPRARLQTSLVGLMVLSLVCAEVLLWSSPVAAFYQTPARFWELAAGGLVSTLPARALPPWVGWGGLVLTLAACFVPLPHFPGVGALPAVAGAALVLAAVHGGAGNALLASRPMVGVGLISYSLYLWHWPLLAFDRLLRVGDSPLPVRLLLVAAAVVLAIASYRYIEQPFRRLRTSSRRLVAGGFALMVALSCGAWAVRKPVPPTVPERISLSCRGMVVARTCLGTEPKVVIWGDSMAHAWMPMAQALGAKLHVPVTNLALDGCPPLLGAKLTLRWPEESVRCEAFNREAAAYLRTHGADTLVIVGRWELYPTGALAQSVAAASPYVRRILIIGPTPTIADHIEKCQALGSDCGVPREKFEKDVARARATLASLRDPKVTIAEPGDWLCSSTRCPGVRDGLVLYRDQAHIAPQAAWDYSATIAKDWR